MKIRLTVMLVVVICLGSFTRLSGSEPLAVVDPAQHGFDVEKLGAIDELMERNIQQGRMVGCTALVARADDVVYYKTWGQRDREADQPMTKDTIFRIYSMSKPITSVAIMQLVEQGKVDLDRPIETYLPEFANMKVLEITGDEKKEVDAKRQMTVRDLLRHTSGLTYGFFGSSDVDRKYLAKGILGSDRNLKETITKLASVPLKHQPGTVWEYSVSTDVLGRVVEVASEQRFDRYLQEHVFAPLKMNDTAFMVPQDKMKRFAQMYAPDGDGLKPARQWASRRFVNPKNEYFSGGGGLCSTTENYLRFCQMLLRGGELDGQRLLKSETIEEMTRNQLESDVKRRGGFRFGLGFAITPQGDYRWGGAAGTRFWINPEKKIIGIFMVQINPYRRNYGEQMKQLVYRADTQN